MTILSYLAIFLRVSTRYGNFETSSSESESDKKDDRRNKNDGWGQGGSSRDTLFLLRTAFLVDKIDSLFRVPLFGLVLLVTSGDIPKITARIPTTGKVSAEAEMVGSGAETIPTTGTVAVVGNRITGPETSKCRINYAGGLSKCITRIFPKSQ